MKDFRGKTALVTGGASGIGLALARLLRSEGATVVIADIDHAAVTAAAADSGTIGYPVDVASLASVSALAERIRKDVGRVDLLCNNAGIGPLARIEDTTIADWEWMLGVNLWGVLHGIHCFLPAMVASGEPAHILNTASLAGLSTQRLFGPYSVAKYGVVALSEALAAELASERPHIGVTVLCPGPVRTRLEESSRNRPSDSGGGLRDIPLCHDVERSEAGIPWRSPVEAARCALAAVREKRLYAITHPELFERVERRSAALKHAFANAVEHGDNHGAV